MTQPHPDRDGWLPQALCRRIAAAGWGRETWRYSRRMRTLLLLASLTLLPQGIDAPRILQPDFKKLMAARNVVIVDTRVADVFSSGHIPGAVLLPLEGSLTWPERYEKTVSTLLATKKVVVTYCA
jgi:predicted sulfurtransferase